MGVLSSLSYDVNINFFWVGLNKDIKLCVYRYIIEFLRGYLILLFIILILFRV